MLLLGQILVLEFKCPVSQMCISILHNRVPPVTKPVTLTSFRGANSCLAQGKGRVSGLGFRV